MQAQITTLVLKPAMTAAAVERKQRWACNLGLGALAEVLVPEHRVELLDLLLYVSPACPPYSMAADNGMFEVTEQEIIDLFKTNGLDKGISVKEMTGAFKAKVSTKESKGHFIALIKKITRHQNNMLWLRKEYGMFSTHSATD